MAAFSSVGRARSEVAITAPRLREQRPRSSSPLVPPCIPMTTRRPSVASAETLRPRYFAPMLSRMTSAPPGLLEHLDEVLVAVADRPVGAQRLAQLELLRRAGGGEHPRAERLGELDREAADAARAAVHEQGLVRLQAGDHEHVGPDRAGHLREGRGALDVHAGRQRHHLPGGHGHLLGVPPGREERAHLVAHLMALDALADRADPARALEAEHVGGALRRRVEALPLQRVGAVDRAGDDVDDDLARTRLGVGQLGDGQGLGTTRVGCDDGTHARHPTRGAGHVAVGQTSTSRTASTSSSSSSCSSSSGDLSQRCGQCGRQAREPLDLGRVAVVRRLRRTPAGTSRSAPPGARPGGRRRGRGPGSAPRRPRPRCRARRTARRSSRAGSRFTVLRRGRWCATRIP